MGCTDESVSCGGSCFTLVTVENARKSDVFKNVRLLCRFACVYPIQPLLRATTTSPQLGGVAKHAVNGVCFSSVSSAALAWAQPVAQRRTNRLPTRAAIDPHEHSLETS